MIEINLNAVDWKILSILQQDGRIRLNRLAEQVGLSAPACHSRIEKLESFGYIKGYVAVLGHRKAGFDVVSLVFVDFEDHSIEKRNQVLDALKSIDEVVEILHITGSHDLQLRVMVKNSQQLNLLVNDKIAAVDGVAKVHTSMVLDICKPMRGIPIKAP
ncbi:Lrp/AsnC family transcriptional regulator [Aliikangiella sp. IMCC44359]|uniref:Lrp/AsnC family transcriptional regulator n=1 Tax=Aliikangiella sp. IMCC44359 TaxID=3459125 RepID=UPI00403A8FEE